MRFALVDHMRVSLEEQQTIELDVGQVTPSSTARVFSVSDYHYKIKLCTMTGLACVPRSGPTRGIFIYLRATIICGYKINVSGFWK